MLNIEKQIRKLYASSVLGNLSLTGAWVAILAARGYNLVDIGIAETVFHITSLIFEIPSGVLADVFGRKKMLIVSSIMRMIGNIIMILSDNLFTVCLSIAFHALSYNFSSGTGDALAYDSLKAANAASRFERFESDQLVIYRLCSGISTLCAGFALSIGHRLAYGTDLITGVIQIAVLMSLSEMYSSDPEQSGKGIAARLAICLKESFTFMKSAKRAMKLMIVNSLIGAADTLLLFFLQAKLPERGIPARKATAALKAADRNPYSWNMEFYEYPDGSGYEGRFTKCGICVLMKKLGLYDLTPALCRLDYTMSEAGGVTNFVRQYTLASGGPYCDCGYKKKG